MAAVAKQNACRRRHVRPVSHAAAKAAHAHRTHSVRLSQKKSAAKSNGRASIHCLPIQPLPCPVLPARGQSLIVQRLKGIAPRESETISVNRRGVAFNSVDPHACYIAEALVRMEGR